MRPGRIHEQTYDTLPMSDCNSVIVAVLFDSHISSNDDILFNLSSGTLTVIAMVS